MDTVDTATVILGTLSCTVDTAHKNIWTVWL